MLMSISESNPVSNRIKGDAEDSSWGEKRIVTLCTNKLADKNRWERIWRRRRKSGFLHAKIEAIVGYKVEKSSRQLESRGLKSGSQLKTTDAGDSSLLVSRSAVAALAPIILWGNPNSLRSIIWLLIRFLFN